MSDHRRQVFILSELEQMGALDIAAVVNANVNTVYSRLRAARLEAKRRLGDSAQKLDRSASSSPVGFDTNISCTASDVDTSR